MGTRRLVPLAVLLGLALAGHRTVYADGACVVIDTSRDMLVDDERVAVRIAAETALEKEGVAIDRTGRCTAVVVLSNIRAGRAITTTISSGGNSVNGQASSIDELDLLVRQLVRSLVTGRMFATGTGVQDRENVLRDQTAPRRVSAIDRMWIPVGAIGGGMLQLPAVGDTRPMQRQYNIVSLDTRLWGFLTGSHNAIELRARLLLHDYAAVGTAADRYKRDRDEMDDDFGEAGWGSLVVLSPLAVGNWDSGIGLVRMLGEAAPRPYVRAGAQFSLLFKVSDPDHRFDIGLGGYAGLGFELSAHWGLSVEVNLSRPVGHDIADSGYAYFLTTTAMLEFRGEPKLHKNPLGVPQEPVQTIRRINE
jgi:hypothetical protein